MLKTTLTAYLALFLVASGASHAGNKVDDDPIFEKNSQQDFHSPVVAGGEMMGGTLLLLLGPKARGDIVAAKRAVKRAQALVDKSADLITELDRTDLITFYGGEFTRYVHGSEPSREAMALYESLKRGAPVTLEMRQAMLESAAANLEYRTRVAFNDSGFLARFLGPKVRKTVHVVRLGAAVLIFIDAGQRLYVWKQLDAKPTFSPLYTSLLGHWVKSLFPSEVETTTDDPTTAATAP